MEDALYESDSIRRFAGIDLEEEGLLDETTILKFRRRHECHGLTSQMMNVINDTLTAKGVLLKGGTMVDAMIIHASPSTKNKGESCEPEMHQTKKGNQCYFGMKVHMGAEVNSNLVRTVSVTTANTSDITELPDLLRVDDRAVLGDSAYQKKSYKRAARPAGVYWWLRSRAGLGALWAPATERPTAGSLASGRGSSTCSGS